MIPKHPTTVCVTAAKLYNAWAAELVQLTGDDALRKPPPPSEKAQEAREAYEAHVKTCKTCRGEA